jgi:hypothetical protein
LPDGLESVVFIEAHTARTSLGTFNLLFTQPLASLPSTATFPAPRSLLPAFRLDPTPESSFRACPWVHSSWTLLMAARRSPFDVNATSCRAVATGGSKSCLLLASSSTRLSALVRNVGAIGRKLDVSHSSCKQKRCILHGSRLDVRYLGRPRPLHHFPAQHVQSPISPSPISIPPTLLGRSSMTHLAMHNDQR